MLEVVLSFKRYGVWRSGVQVWNPILFEAY